MDDIRMKSLWHSGHLLLTTASVSGQLGRRVQLGGESREFQTCRFHTPHFSKSVTGQVDKRDMQLTWLAKTLVKGS